MGQKVEDSFRKVELPIAWGKYVERLGDEFYADMGKAFREFPYSNEYGSARVDLKARANSPWTVPPIGE